MQILKYITIILTAVLGIFAVLKEYKKKGSKKLEKAGVVLIILISVLLSASILLEVLSSRDLKNKEEELNKYILGEGYAVFNIYGGSKQGEYTGLLESKSKYPIYDVSLLVTDFDEAIKCKTSLDGEEFYFDTDCYFDNSTNVEGKTIPPGIAAFLVYSLNSPSEFKNLEIKLTSRSTSTLQQAVYKLQSGICPQSYRIYKIEKGTLTLIIVKNDLGLPDSYWNKNFYPVQNRNLCFFFDEKKDKDSSYSSPK